VANIRPTSDAVFGSVWTVERTVGTVSIGSDLTAARERAGLTIEQLSAETRIRPGLIAAMEADDFTRCGGNFYARGHIRAIARALDTDPAPLLARYDESQSIAPVPDRGRREERVAAQPPPLRAARPRWAALLAVILIGAMGWGLVRLFAPSHADQTVDPPGAGHAVTTTPTARPPAKPTVPRPPATTPPGARRVTLTLTATRDGSYVTLRNYHGVRLFQGLLGPSSSHTITYPGAIRVRLEVARNIGIFVNGKRVYPKARTFMITVAGAVELKP
jgi:cytoskeleton protein RodZ